MWIERIQIDDPEWEWVKNVDLYVLNNNNTTTNEYTVCLPQNHPILECIIII